MHPNLKFAHQVRANLENMRQVGANLKSSNLEPNGRCLVILLISKLVISLRCPESLGATSKKIPFYHVPMVKQALGLNREKTVVTIDVTLFLCDVNGSNSQNFKLWESFGNVEIPVL